MNNQQNSNQINWSEFHKPVVLEKGQWKREKEKRNVDNSEKSPYLLMDELSRAFDLISEFQVQHSEWLDQQSKDKKSAGEFNVPMNLAIVGERGSGKTSAVKSLKIILEEENYYVFDIVDPNTLSSEINILEILVSHIYKKICESEREDLYQKEDMISLLKRIMTVLAIKRQKDAFLRKDNPSIDVLDKIKDLVELDDLIVDLFEKFRKFISRTGDKEEVKDLVLIIDDLDLVDHQYINKLISEIQEFLNSKLIIVLAYRNSQLEEAILSDKVEKNKSLLDKEIIFVEELRGKVERMLYKLLPPSHKIYLYDQNELLKISYISIFDSLKIKKKERIDNLLSIIEEENDANDAEEKDTRVEDWIYQKILRLTCLYIKPVDTKETVELFLPKSLRELIQLFEIVSRISVKTTNNEKNVFEKIEMALIEFKEYFFNKVRSILSTSTIDLLRGWDLANSNQKNYLCFHFFYNKFKDDILFDMKDKYPFDLKDVENQNIRLGDVYEIMELYKIHIAKRPTDFFMVYVMKVMYSVELTRLVVICQNNAKKISRNKTIKENIEKLKYAISYLDLVNTNFMPANHNYFEYISKRKEADYVMKYNKYNVEEKLKVEEFVTSTYPCKGDVITGFKMEESPFRYRRIYTYWPIAETDMIHEKNYVIEYFVLFAKAKYLIDAVLGNDRAITLSKNGENVDVYFLLVSMFQIDIFVRNNYARRTEENKQKYAIEQMRYAITKNSLQYLDTPVLHALSKGYYQREKDNMENPKVTYVFPYKYKEGNFRSGETDELMKIFTVKVSNSKEISGLNFSSKKNVRESIKKLSTDIDDEEIKKYANLVKKEYLETDKALNNKEVQDLIIKLVQKLKNKYDLIEEED